MRLSTGQVAWFPLAGLVAGQGEKSSFLLVGLGMQDSSLPAGVCEAPSSGPDSTLNEVSFTRVHSHLSVLKSLLHFMQGEQWPFSIHTLLGFGCTVVFGF